MAEGGCAAREGRQVSGFLDCLIFKFAQPLTRFRLSLFSYSPSVKIACEVGGAYDLDHHYTSTPMRGRVRGRRGLRPRPRLNFDAFDLGPYDLDLFDFDSYMTMTTTTSTSTTSMPGLY